MDAITRWHDYVERRDPTLLEALIAEGAVFQSPAVHKPQEGKAVTIKYLTAAMIVLGTESFRYPEQWIGESSAVLEFEAEVDGLIVNGVDMIWWDETGRITRFKVMIRPLKALNVVVERMRAELMRAG